MSQNKLDSNAKPYLLQEFKVLNPEKVEGIQKLNFYYTRIT